MERFYDFTAKAGYEVKGYVVAKNKQEAIRKIKNLQYDEIDDAELMVITELEEIVEGDTVDD